MPTPQIDRSRRSPPGSTRLLAACVLAPALAGCVDILGDYKPSGCDRADCTATWARRFGDQDEQHASGVALTKEDAIVVVGDVFGAIDFGGGDRESVGDADVFVAKLDPAGEHLWSARFGGLGPDYGNAVAVDSSALVSTLGDLSAGLYVQSVGGGGGHGGSSTSNAKGGNSAVAVSLGGSGGTGGGRR